jgi:hypothetical protein
MPSGTPTPASSSSPSCPCRGRSWTRRRSTRPKTSSPLWFGIDLYGAGLVHHATEADELGERAAWITTLGAIPVAFASAAGCAGPTYPDTAGQSGIWAADGALLAGATAAPGEIARAVLLP